MQEDNLKQLAGGTVATVEAVVREDEIQTQLEERRDDFYCQIFTNGNLEFGKLTHVHKDDSSVCIFTPLNGGDQVVVYEGSVTPSLAPDV